MEHRGPRPARCRPSTPPALHAFAAALPALPALMIRPDRTPVCTASQGARARPASRRGSGRGHPALHHVLRCGECVRARRREGGGDQRPALIPDVVLRRPASASPHRGSDVSPRRSDLFAPPAEDGATSRPEDAAAVADRASADSRTRSARSGGPARASGGSRPRRPATSSADPGERAFKTTTLRGQAQRCASTSTARTGWRGKPGGAVGGHERAGAQGPRRVPRAPPTDRHARSSAEPPRTPEAGTGQPEGSRCCFTWNIAPHVPAA